MWQVLRYQGPNAAQPGAFDKVVAQLEEGTGNPWDVKCFKTQLIISVHNGQKGFQDSRIVIFDPETGEEQMCIRSKLLDEPNMMALE